MEHLNLTTEILTLEEARERLPRVRLHLLELREATQVIRDTHQKLTDDRAAPDVEALEEAIEEAQVRWKEELQALNDLGVYVKDPEAGLIDFYTWRDEQIVFLCYHLGEEDICTWHGLDEGFRGRKPL